MPLFASRDEEVANCSMLYVHSLKSVVVGDTKGNVRLFNLEMLENGHVNKLHEETVNCILDFDDSADRKGTVVLTTSYDRKLRLLDLSNFETLVHF